MTVEVNLSIERAIKQAKNDAKDKFALIFSTIDDEEYILQYTLEVLADDEYCDEIKIEFAKAALERIKNIKIAFKAVDAVIETLNKHLVG